MKKILLVSNMYPSDKYKYYGIFVKNVEKLLEDNGFIVSKVVITKQDNNLLKLINYILLHFKVIIKGLFCRYDYLYVHFVSHSSLGAVLVKKIKKHTKLILNCHGNDVVADTNRDLKNIKRSQKYLQYADYVVAPSNYFKNILIKDYNIAKKKIFVYPSGGVNTNLFINKEKDNSKSNCQLNINYNYIGYISRIEKDKGWDTFLYMIKELEKINFIKKYNLKFLIVGIGDEEKEMNELIQKLNIENYIERREMVSQEKLVDIYNSLEIFVFPTRRKSESLGLVGLEAMSCETLTIAGSEYGPSDYIKDFDNGLTFINDNYNDLVLKVKKYFSLDEKTKCKIRKNGRDVALKYDVLLTKNKILDIFK